MELHSTRGTSFSIRSFGSWGEARWDSNPVSQLRPVSVSALSDRGVRLVIAEHRRDDVHVFQYPLFRIVG